MAIKPEPTPAPLEEVDAPPAQELITAPTNLPAESFEYQSSEQLQRAHNADVFAREQKNNVKVALTEKQKIFKVLNKVIQEHSSTKTVRDIAKKNKRGAMYQLDLSADIVTILDKIKSDLR